MANDNNNINELVADDDDPTVELEVLSLGQHGDGAAETDAKTYDAQQDDDAELPAGVTVSELQSDLRSRKKTIDQLQYDIQQLHSKWLGLETEINARETQTSQLNVELSSSRDAIARKEQLVKKRDRKIKLLKSEIRDRDDDYRQLKSRFDNLSQAPAPETPPPESTAASRDAGNPKNELQLRLGQSEKYADSIRQKCQDLIESNSGYEREIENLTHLLDGSKRENKRFSDELALAEVLASKLQAELTTLQDQHDEEIRLLRFELGDAQNTVVETEDLNNQLASDLVDARGFKEELERMLGDVEDQSSERIGELQKQVSKLTRVADSYEQKLTTKSEAISILLAELAKNSEQIESIGEIEDVIQDIDDRMSERSIKSSQESGRPTGDRVTRLMVGTIDDQVLRFPLFKERLTIGRTKDNDIQLNAAYVSRRHAVIQTDEEETRIIDWGSKNGIIVNSERVSEHFLKHGDIVTIGNARFRYEERKKRDS